MTNSELGTHPEPRVLQAGGHSKRAGGNRLLVYTLDTGPALLKVYRRRGTRFRELFKEQPRDLDAVILDLGETTSVDSSALGSILALREHLPDIEIRIAAPSESVRKSLVAASFDRLFRIL